MVLGHEVSGIVKAVGERVTGLAVGDRVCMEPGIPDPSSRASKLGVYNVDPAVRFWATPPVHGCLVPEAVHPAAHTYKLPDTVSFDEGAMVEPLAIGMQAATRARLQQGSDLRSNAGEARHCGTLPQRRAGERTPRRTPRRRAVCDQWLGRRHRLLGERGAGGFSRPLRSRARRRSRCGNRHAGGARRSGHRGGPGAGTSG